MAAKLQKFKGKDIKLTADEAWQVLVFFFGGKNLKSPSWLSENDRSFAQALLIEAVDASKAKGWIESVFRSAMKPTASVTSVLKKLAKHAAKSWFKSLTPADLTKAEIYTSVRDSLVKGWRSSWETRIQDPYEMTDILDY